MSLHRVSEPTMSRDGPANSVTLGELAALMHVPLPQQARLASGRVELQHKARHDVLYRSGDAFEFLYVVLSGALKLVTANGAREHVLAFVVSGETAGVDGFQSGSHCVDASVLDAADVALVRVMELEQLAERAGEGELGNQLMHRILTQAMVQDATLLCMLETLDARIRVAAFLLSLRNRFARVHRPPTPFDVPVSDAEIGSYLRLPDEAVGAVLREFVDAGVIDVRERKVSLTRPTALAAMVEEGRQSPVRHAVVPD